MYFQAPSLLQQVLTTNPQNASTVQSSAVTTSTLVTPTTTSSLIKSLLANKVTTANSDTNIPATVVSMNQTSVISSNASNNLHQVTFLTNQFELNFFRDIHNSREK